jgi:hypothetical protein
MIRHCPNCLRHTETEHVSAESVEEPYYDGSIRKLRVTTVIPGYSVCTYCGWCYGYDQDDSGEGACALEVTA